MLSFYFYCKASFQNHYFNTKKFKSKSNKFKNISVKQNVLYGAHFFTVYWSAGCCYGKVQYSAMYYTYNSTDLLQIYNTFQIFAQCWQNSAVFSQSTYKYILHGFCNVFPRELASFTYSVLYCTLYCTEHCTVLYIVLYCTLYCTVHCTVLNTVLYWTLYCTVHCTALYIVMYWTLYCTEHCTVLYIVLYCKLYTVQYNVRTFYTLRLGFLGF